MRDLDSQLVTRFCNTADLSCARVLWIQGQDATVLDDTSKLSRIDVHNSELLPNAYLINLSRNKLTGQNLPFLWKMFPSAWWVDLSRNLISDLSSVFPLVLGSLNLVGNDIQEKDLFFVSKSHILRLSLSIDFKTSDAASRNRALVQFIVKHLPNVWVLNDDYIVSRYKVDVSQTVASAEREAKQSAEVWRTKPNTVKEQNLLCAIQDLPTYDAIADAFKLDILLEDYLQEAAVLNTFTDQLALSNTSAIKTSFMQNLNPLLNGKSMPSIDLYQILLIPHGLRLDLSVILTASILYHIPTTVFNDTLVILLSKYMSVSDLQSLGQLPLFARTAIVSIIRRICRRELDELAANGHLLPKPARQHNMTAADHNEFPQSRLNYKGVDGFYFLRPIKSYLLRPIDIEAAGISRQQQQQFQQQKPSMHFTEVEMEILRKLPDTPTLSSCTQEFDDGSESYGNRNHPHFDGSETSVGSLSSGSNVPHYKKWTSYVARHTVLLLTKSPTCPPLTRQQTTKASQDIYSDMLPLLAAAQMTLEDLDVELSGPNTDGRMLRAQLSKSLQFGVGLPQAGPASLAWNAMDSERFRNYKKPWRPVPPQEMDDTFLTTNSSKAKSPHRNVGNTTRQVVRESHSSRPLSPSFVLSSEANSRHGSAVPDSKESPQRQLQHHLHQQAQLQMQLAHRLRQHDIERALSISILPNSRPPSGAPRTAQSPNSNQHSPINSPNELRSRPFSSTIRESINYFDDLTTTTSNLLLSTERAASIDDAAAEKRQDLPPRAQLAAGVKGYSADARHEPTFLLASPTNIQHQNSALQQCGSVLKWDNIEHAPVVLPMVSVSVIPVEAAVGLSAKLTERSERNSQHFGLIDSVALNPFDMSTMKEDSNSLSAKSGKLDELNLFSRHSRVVDVFDDDLSDAASGKSITGKNDKSALADLRMDVINSDKANSSDNQKQLLGVLSAASTDDGSHTIDIDDQSGETGSVLSQTRQQLQILLGGKEKVSNLGASWNQIHLTQAKDLLVEMGTVKNLRQLERLNVSDKLGRKKRANKSNANSKAVAKEAATPKCPSSPTKPIDPNVIKPESVNNESSFFLTLLSSSAHAVKKEKASRSRPTVDPAASARKSNLNTARTGSNDSNDELDDDFFDDVDDFDEDDDEADLDDLDSEVDNRVDRKSQKSKWTDGRVNTQDYGANDALNPNENSAHSLDQSDEGIVATDPSPKIKAKDSFLDVLTRNSSRNCNLSPKTNEATEPAGSPLQATISLVEAVKLTTNYDKVFTLQNGVELGAKSANGKQISPTWYPCDKKVMYRLSLPATLNLQKPQLQPLQPQSTSLKQNSSGVPVVRPPSDPPQSTGLEPLPQGKEEFGAGVTDELSLRHDDYFRSLLRPLRPRRSVTAVIPLPVAERDSSSHARQQQQQVRKLPKYPQQRRGGVVDLELSSPLSLLSQSLQPPPLPLTFQDGFSMARSQTSSSTSQLPHRPTAGPAPPFPSLVSLHRSASISSGTQRSHSQQPSSPAAGTSSKEVDPFAIEHRDKEDEGMDNLSAILKSSIRGMLHKEDSFQQQHHLPHQPPSEVSSAGSDRHIVPKRTDFTDSYETAAQHISTDGSGGSVVNHLSQSHLLHSSWGSGMWAPLNSPTSSSGDVVHSQPFKGLVAGSSSQQLQRVANTGQMQSYRKHKAATHKLQLNRGFKYSRNNTNFKIDSYSYPQST